MNSTEKNPVNQNGVTRELIALYQRHQMIVNRLNREIDHLHPADDQVWKLKTSKLYHKKMAEELRSILQKKLSITEIEETTEVKTIYLNAPRAFASFKLAAQTLMDNMKLILGTNIIPLYMRNLLIKHRISLYNLYFRNSYLQSSRSPEVRMRLKGIAS